MLKSSAIVISCKNHKIDKFDAICNFVRFTVRHNEYVKISENKDFKALKESFTSACADVDVLTCEESLIKEKLSALDAENLINFRKEINALNAEITATGITIDEFNALSATDKVFITLQAHTAMPAIKLSTDILKDIDMKTPVEKYYSQGTLKGIKNIFRGIFNKVVSEEGELFYGVKLRNSDFSDSDLRNCLAYFRGNAKRTVTKKDGTEIYGTYTWACKEGTATAQAMALTNLFAVVLDRTKDYEVIKPETPVGESQEKTPVEKVEKPQEKSAEKSAK